MHIRTTGSSIRFYIVRVLILFCVCFVLSCGTEEYWETISGSSRQSVPLPAGCYVHPSGSDLAGTTGAHDDPFLTISYAIGRAGTDGHAAVHVAAGMYAGPLALAEGISLYGGYNSTNWKDRNNLDRSNPTYQTIITVAVGNAVNAAGSITSATVVDGFTLRGRTAFFNSAGASPLISNNTIEGLAGPNVHGIMNDNSSPTIQFNLISGGEGSANSIGINSINNSSPTIIGNSITGCPTTELVTWSRGIYNSDSTPVIVGNIIGGAGEGSTVSYGIHNMNSNAIIAFNYIRGGKGNTAYGLYNVNCDPKVISNHVEGGDNVTDVNTGQGIYIDNCPSEIYNNVINGGRAADNTYGIVIQNASSPKIYNNTIDGGSITNPAGEAVGINMILGSPSIRNNIIMVSSTAGTRTGIREGNAGADPAELNNNNINNCATALYYDMDGHGNLVDIADVDSAVNTTQGLPASASGNHSVSLNLDSEYRILGAWIPGELTLVTRGGLDLSSPFLVEDKDENPRTVHWSIGAYEYD